MKNLQGTNKQRMPRLLSLKEVAEIFGGTVWTWRERIWRGDIPVVPIGRKHYLDTEDIEKYITSRKIRYGKE